MIHGDFIRDFSPIFRPCLPCVFSSHDFPYSQTVQDLLKTVVKECTKLLVQHFTQQGPVLSWLPYELMQYK